LLCNLDSKNIYTLNNVPNKPGELMESLKEKASKVSYYLQRLRDSTTFSEVQSAVARKDKDAFIKACRKVKIPKKYIVILMTILLTVEPAQIRWP